VSGRESLNAVYSRQIFNSPAVAGAGEVALTALIARELGGNRFVQSLAAVATLVAPGILAGDNLLSMNAFEPLFWMGFAWLLIPIVRTGNPKLWIWSGILADFGLENKYSMLIFGAGVVFGLLLTPQRRMLLTPWLWIGGAIAFLIFLPNLLWNMQHGFPFLELQANIRRTGRDVPLTHSHERGSPQRARIFKIGGPYTLER
jgi:4-amino-4-deoxy-L-arabinose transferase-like glycosyltransferase